MNFFLRIYYFFQRLITGHVESHEGRVGFAPAGIWRTILIVVIALTGLGLFIWLVVELIQHLHIEISGGSIVGFLGVVVIFITGFVTGRLYERRKLK